MTGKIQAPGTVHQKRALKKIPMMILGPLRSAVIVAQAEPVPPRPIKAIWTNETGDAPCK